MSPAERDVADLAVEGLSNREIGERLFISHRTVETHLRYVYRKCNVRSRVALVNVAPAEAQ